MRRAGSAATGVATDRRRRRHERGQMGGIEALPFGLLIFVVGALLIGNAWAVIDTKAALVSASREAARVYVEGDGRQAPAVLAARDAFEGHGRDPDRLQVEIELGGNGTFGRCVPVTVRSSAVVPALALPWIGGFGEAFTVTARHTERVDPFRDGLEGVAEW
jgi:hypothetical protein